MEEYLNVLKKYAQFSGRATRREFWLFVLINAVISFAISVALGFLSSMTGVAAIGYLSYIYPRCFRSHSGSFC